MQQCLPGPSHGEMGGATLVDSQSAGSQTQGQPEDASLYAEAEAIAVEEHEYHLEQRRLAEERARQEDEHESSLESWESEMQRVMEMFAPYEAAKEARAWDNWAMWDSMNRPQVRTRAHVEVEVGPAEGCRGEYKRLKLPVPECCGDEVVVKQARILRGESSPNSSAPTVTVPAAHPEPGSDPPSGSQMEGGSMAGDSRVPHGLDFNNYLTQYHRWCRGEIGDAYITQMWGEGTLDLMRAQEDLELLEQDPKAGEVPQAGQEGDGAGLLPQGSHGVGQAGHEGPAADLLPEGSHGVRDDAGCTQLDGEDRDDTKDEPVEREI